MTDRSRLGPYEIVEPLGAGGMGEVFRAHDPRLQRDVAIKMIAPSQSADPAAIARIVRESRIVASLNHPNIVSIHDVGEEHGRFYLVTELIEGETLRARLRRGTLSPREALDAGIAIASALAAAHDQSVVHRDLKPENVMLTAAGAVKVLDFGVAKSVAAADTVTAPLHPLLTEFGAAVGTPAYMAPEQIEGQTIDHRVDQFALGILLHEMLAGRRPFSGASSADVVAAILRDEPEHLSGVRADLPPALGRIVARCLSKSLDRRYASTADLVHALTDVREDLGIVTTPPPAAVPRRTSYIWAGTIAIAVVVAGIVAALTWSRGRETPATAGAGPRTRAVAVLPFTTIGDVDSYLADGVTEAVTRELGHIDGTRVIASSSSFAYRGRTEGFAQIGRELGVDVMVRGSVQRAGESLRINAALLNTADDTTLWSDNYDRPMADILSVQDDIAWQVAVRLATALGAAAPLRPADTPKTTPEAYDAYLRGVSEMRVGSARFDHGIEALERAVTLDPKFALARARLASAYTQQFFYNATDPALERKAFVEIERALAVNADLAEAYLARAQLIWNLRNGFPHERAIVDVRRALANNPNLAEAHIELGKLYSHIGLIDKAIVANQEALRLDPRSTAALQRLISARIDGGRRQEIADELARNPQWPLRVRAISLAFLGRTDDAINAIAPRGLALDDLKKIDMNEAALLTQMLARQNRRGDAERALSVAIPLAANPTGLSDTHHAQFAIGCAYALLGDSDEAVRWVTKAANEGYPSYTRFSSEPDLAALKDHPGFKSLIERLRKDHERWKVTL